MAGGRGKRGQCTQVAGENVARVLWGPEHIRSGMAGLSWKEA